MRVLLGSVNACSNATATSARRPPVVTTLVNLFAIADTAGRWLPGAGAVLIAGAAAAIALKLVGGARRAGSGRLRAALAGVVIGVSAPGVLRLWVPESATSPAYVVVLLVTDACAVLAVAHVAHDRIAQWELGMRLQRVASEVRAVTGAGAASAARARRVVRAPDLEARYWAARRTAYVDSQGRSTGVSVRMPVATSPWLLARDSRSPPSSTPIR